VKLRWIALSALALLAACRPAQPPEAPTGFTPAVVSSTQINLAWTGSQGATGYILERKTGAASFAQIGGGDLPATQVTFNDTGLSASTQYTYRLKAKNNAGESGGVETSATTQASPPPPPPPPPVAGAIKLSANKRFFLTSDNKPFVYLADNAWYLFQHLSLADADKYLANRAAKGFTVIQASVIWEYNPDTTYGETTTVGGLAPFTNDNPATPNETYFKRVDDIIDSANAKGLYVALNPLWRDRLPGTFIGTGGTKYFDTEAKAKAFATFLGNRYKTKKVLWVLGVADDLSATDATTVARKATWKAIAQSLRDAVGTGQFITFMPPAGSPNSTTSVYPGDALFDVDMVYSGEGVTFFTSAVGGGLLDKGRPVVEGQAVFERYPVTVNSLATRATDYDVRRIAYWNFFSGAAGHTYGHHNVWQFLTDTTTASNIQPGSGIGPQIGNVEKKRWDDVTVIDSAGATQMGFLKKLLTSRPLTDTRSEIAVLHIDTYSTSAGLATTRSLLAENLSFALSYIPQDSAKTKVKVNIGQINGTAPVLVRAWWFNPITGAATKIQENMDRTADVGLGLGVREFNLPNATQDWVLVLDNQAANLGTPGQ
jgi:hypothetical protein